MIRVTVLLSSLEEQDPACQRVQRLLTKLCYIQELAYADESRRTPVNIYAMLNMTYVFWLDYKWVSFDGFHSRIVFHCAKRQSIPHIWSMCIGVYRMGLFDSIYAIASNLLFKHAIDAKAISMDLIKLELFPLAQVQQIS